MDNIGQIVSVRIHNQSYNIRASDGNVARHLRAGRAGRYADEMQSPVSRAPPTR
jgi:hypothetical protein